MICDSCKKAITLDNLGRMTRRGYNVHEHIEDYHCPHCGEDLYPTDKDWTTMTNAEWYAKHWEAQRLCDQEYWEQVLTEEQQ